MLLVFLYKRWCRQGLGQGPHAGGYVWVQGPPSTGLPSAVLAISTRKRTSDSGQR